MYTISFLVIFVIWCYLVKVSLNYMATSASPDNNYSILSKIAGWLCCIVLSPFAAIHFCLGLFRNGK